MTDLARDQVFRRVRRDILDCALMPGAELREGDLARAYGVSKSPVRDAMQRLEQEGLIEIAARRGHRVKPVSLADAEDLLELRAILETGAVRKIIAAAPDAALRDLDRFRSADQGSAQAFSDYNRRFHLHLAEMTGNARLAEETRRILDFYDRLCLVSLSSIGKSGSYIEPLSDHAAIIDAIQARSPAQAARQVQRHIARSRVHIMRGLANRAIVD